MRILASLAALAFLASGFAGTPTETLETTDSVVGAASPALTLTDVIGPLAKINAQIEAGAPAVEVIEAVSAESNIPFAHAGLHTEAELEEICDDGEPHFGLSLYSGAWVDQCDPLQLYLNDVGPLLGIFAPGHRVYGGDFVESFAEFYAAITGAPLEAILEEAVLIGPLGASTHLLIREGEDVLAELGIELITGYVAINGDGFSGGLFTSAGTLRSDGSMMYPATTSNEGGICTDCLVGVDFSEGLIELGSTGELTIEGATIDTTGIYYGGPEGIGYAGTPSAGQTLKDLL